MLSLSVEGARSVLAPDVMRWGNSYRGYHKKNNLLAVVLVAFLALILGFFFIFDLLIAPVILEIAKVEATNIGTEALNKAIERTVGTELDYDSLFKISRDQSSRVTIMQPNTVEVNRIAARTALQVQAELRRFANIGYGVPLGQLTGLKTLANLGPTIPVSLAPAGSVTVSLRSQFEEAGINQTRHTIFLDATTSVKVVIPLVSDATQVSISMPIADVVIVGDVPQFFARITRDLLPSVN